MGTRSKLPNVCWVLLTLAACARENPVLMRRQQQAAIRAARPAATARPSPARGDGVIRAQVERELAQENKLSTASVTAAVRDGVVTLTGQVRTRDQGALAEFLASNVDGVRTVQNQLQLSPVQPRPDNLIARHIELRIQATPDLARKQIVVDVDRGNVTLQGTVSTAQQAGEAVQAAQVPGVRAVDSRNLTVFPTG